MFVQAPFQPSLRDLWSILLLVPGLKLKAWAIFESPSGTLQDRCPRQPIPVIWFWMVRRFLFRAEPFEGRSETLHYYLQRDQCLWAVHCSYPVCRSGLGSRPGF